MLVEVFQVFQIKARNVQLTGWLVHFHGRSFAGVQNNLLSVYRHGRLSGISQYDKIGFQSRETVSSEKMNYLVNFPSLTDYFS